MKKGDRVFGMVGLGLSLWLIVESLQFDYMDEFTPGPGFEPFWLGITLALLSIFLIFGTFKRKADAAVTKPRLPGRKSLLRVGAILLSVAGFACLVDFAGFIITVFVFVCTLLFVLEKYSAVQSLLCGVLFSGSVFLIFRYWMHVDLPKGWLGF